MSTALDSYTEYTQLIFSLLSAVIPSEARNLFVAPRFLVPFGHRERSLGMTKTSFALLPIFLG